MKISAEVIALSKNRVQMMRGCPISSRGFVCKACGKRGADVRPDWLAIKHRNYATSLPGLEPSRVFQS
jgi:hypothetical protein